jgi:hypothetical protein
MFKKAVQILVAAALVISVATPAQALKDARIKRYAAAATCTALTAVPNAVIGCYGIDTGAFWLWSGSAWVAVASGSGIIGTNGGIIDNETNGAWSFAEASEDLTLTFTTNDVAVGTTTGVLEVDFGTITVETAAIHANGTSTLTVLVNSEDLVFTGSTNDMAVTSSTGVLEVDFGTINLETDEIDANGTGTLTVLVNSEDMVFTGTSNLLTMSSGTSATFAFTPAVAFTGDISANGGVGALTMSGSGDSSIVLADADTTALVVGAAGALDILGVDTTDASPQVNITGVTQQTALHVVTGNLEVDGQTLPSPGLFETFSEGAAGKGIHNNEPDWTAFTGTAQAPQNMHNGNGHVFAFAALGDNQATQPVMAATGVDFAGDQADNEGYEVNIGWFGATGRPFIVGTDPAFFFCMSSAVTDIDGGDEYWIGFRKVEDAYNAAPNGYTDYYAIGFNAAADPAAIFVENELNGAGANSDDTSDTWDGTAKKFCVNVSNAGLATATNDGAAPSTPPTAYTFDDGDMLIPYFMFIQVAAAFDNVVITEFEAGFQGS